MSQFNPGVHPNGARVVVFPDETVETRKGLIVIPEQVQQRYRDAQTIGTIVELGPTAFKFEEKTYEATSREANKPGTRVVFAKYGGVVIKGKDGLQYRMIWDDDVLGYADEDFKLVIGE